MAISTQDRNDLVRIVVGMFNGAPGSEILSQLTNAFEAGQTRAQIATNLAKTAEYQSLFPDNNTNAEVATKIVNNIVGNLATDAVKADAVALLTAQLNSKPTVTSAQKAAARAEVTLWALDALKAIPATDAGLGAVVKALANKTEVAVYYSVDAQQNPSSVTAAQDVLVGVDDTDASVDAAIEELGNIRVEGETYNLGVAVDTISGTSFDDTINALSVNPTTGAAASTLNAFDKIDGGNGIDTLNIYTTATENATLPASTSVKNVEIVNVYNAAAAAAFGDASKFEGVQQLWQHTAAVAVTNLGAATTAGFSNIAAGALAVTPTATASSASVAVDALTGASTLTVNAGTALNTVNISGSLAAGAANTLATTANVGAAQTNLTFTSSVATTLTTAGAALVSVDASKSTGGLTYVGGAAISSIKSGSAADTVTLGTTTSATISAVAETGDGNDTITVSTTGAGTTTVNSGAGNDTITLTGTSSGKLTVNAGAGNDKVVATVGLPNIKGTDLVDGGEGTDIISIAGQATYAAEDYIILTEVITNFETLELTGGTAATVDASKLAGYTTFNAAQSALTTLTKVAAGQAIVASTATGVTASANGYVVPSTGNIGTLVGTLNITSTIGNTITANGETVNLTISPTANNDAVADKFTTTLTGDAKVANVTLVATTDNNKTTSPTTDDFFETTDFILTTADKAGNLDGLTTLVLSGNGTATVTNAASTALVTVDASALASKTISGAQAAGLTYTSTNAAVETITLGSAKDSVTLGASTQGAMDTVTGLTLVDDSATAGTQIDLTKSDAIQVNDSGAVNVAGFTKTTVTAASLNLALIDLAASTTADAVVFAFGGNTYIYVDTDAAGSAAGANDVVDAADLLVKITGTVDLDLLVGALNA